MVLEKLCDDLVDGVKGYTERETLVIESKAPLSQVREPLGKLNQLRVSKCAKNMEICRWEFKHIMTVTQSLETGSTNEK